MKPLLFFAALAFASTAAYGQRKAVFLEWGMPFHGIGLSLDSRLSSHSLWGYRVGLGWSHTVKENTSYRNDREHGFAVPIEMNYLSGRGRHHWEGAAGLTVGYYWLRRCECHQWGPVYSSFSWDHYVSNSVYDDHSYRSLGYYIYANIGYRYQTDRGLMLRVGITFNSGSGGYYKVYQDESISPYLGMGYTF